MEEFEVEMDEIQDLQSSEDCEYFIIMTKYSSGSNQV